MLDKLPNLSVFPLLSSVISGKLFKLSVLSVLSWVIIGKLPDLSVFPHLCCDLWKVAKSLCASTFELCDLKQVAGLLCASTSELCHLTLVASTLCFYFWAMILGQLPKLSVNENHNHRKLTKLITRTTALSISMELWDMPCRATQDGWVIVESSVKTWSLEKEMVNHISILALRTPWTVWKGKKIWHWKMNSTGQ